MSILLVVTLQNVLVSITVQASSCTYITKLLLLQ